ncbi:tetratricopeptide repeat protein [Flavobacteriaceae bacterium R38]|nr:tetratricopeptide repeat protein [Flavobacteriaceae bacterium R38]
MKKYILLFCLFVTALAFSQEDEKAKQKAARQSNNLVYEANDKLEGKEFIDAEVSYRKAISKNDENAVAKYNLGNAYYKENSLEEAFTRYKQAGDIALSKAQKHKAFHNIGNIFMKNKEFEKAVEAYKEALRNDPTDDETRYNLALAKQKKEQEGGGGDNDKDQNQDQKDQKDQDKKDGDKGDKDKEGDQKEDKKDDGKEGENDQKDGEKKPDENNEEGDKKEDKKDEGKGDKQPKDEKGEPKKPRPNQLSPQQIKNLLEAMNNAEKKVQKKLNAKKVKGVPVKNEKDW